MSVIMKRTIAAPTIGQAPELEPVVYVDSLIESSYIDAIKTIIMRKVRELNFDDEIYGSSDITPNIVTSEADLNTKDIGFWILDTTVRDSDKRVTTHSFTLYQRIRHGSWWYSYENIKLFEFYNVKCKRSVPRIAKKPTRFQQFTDELESAVSEFKSNAERDGVLISGPRN